MNASGAARLKVLAHRGLWTTREEQNSMCAFSAAWSAGAGVETDLRDLDGTIVISHDMPRSTSRLLTLSQFLGAWQDHGCVGEMALNIKSDGIAQQVAAAVTDAGASAAAFVFDMSVPDQLSYAKTDLRTFSRWSEIEDLRLDRSPAGVWLDAFWDDGWWDAGAVSAHLRDGTAVALVSPELHGRPHLPVWERLREEQLHTEPALSLCTDHVREATAFFGLSLNTTREVMA